MNQHEPPTRDELADRLLDAALCEVVGGQAPPALSARILAAHGAATAHGDKHLAAAGPVTLAPEAGVPSINALRRPFSPYLATVAATVLLGGGVLLGLTASVDSVTESSHRPRQVALAEPRPAVRRQTVQLRTQEVSPEEKAPAPAASVVADGKTSSSQGEQGNAGLSTRDAVVSGPSPATPHRDLFRDSSARSSPASVADELRGESNVVELSELASAAEQPASGAEGQSFARTKIVNRSYGGRGLSPAAAGKSVDAPRDQLLLGVAPRVIVQEQESSLEFGFREHLEGKPDDYYAWGKPRGRGPGAGGDKYNRIVDNPFLAVSPDSTERRLSTFSIDVDTASYANVRQLLLQGSTLPPPDAVRIEELLNYFPYDDAPPADGKPFAARIETAACPWNREHRLVRIGIKGREVERTHRPPSNLVFLVDVSGSMDEPNKLPLLLEGLRMMTRQLGENDRVGIVVYASSEGVALESARGDQHATILAALDQLRAGGSTAGGAGILRAYQMAVDHFIKGGVNRVILCTDGDFNVGVTSPAELQRLAENKARDTGVFLTVLGFGRGNLNDAMMEQIADKGNGNYHYVDARSEAQKVLVEQLSGTLVAIAKDVKIQVEFNPARVAGYRLIGYENRILAAEDFNDDKKDAGEIGAGHAVTALYEIVPVGRPVVAGGVDELKYEPRTPGASTQSDPGAAALAAAPASPELLSVKIRFKEPDGQNSTKLEFPVVDAGGDFAVASDDFRFAAAVAQFGMLLRDSPHKGESSWANVIDAAEAAAGSRDDHGYRREFVQMAERARDLSAVGK